MSKTSEFFEETARRVAERSPELRYTPKQPVRIVVEGEGSWMVTFNGGTRLWRDDKATDPVTIHISRRDAEAVIQDPVRVWTFLLDGQVEVDDVCAAAAFVETAWPGTMQKAMPPQLYEALFHPRPSRSASWVEHLNQIRSPHWTEYLVEGEPQKCRIEVEGAMREFWYVEHEGLAVTEGDIVLGTVEEVRSGVVRGMVIKQKSGKWPDKTLPYTIDDSKKGPSPDTTDLINEAIDHINSNTNVTITGRNGQANYVTFQSGNGCRSGIGKFGNGQQFITLDSDCTKVAIIHEICHTLGLWHEQNRFDRDDYVTIEWDNIQNGLEDDFKIPSADNAEDEGSYDFLSIMHYAKNAFSKSAGQDTIECKPPYEEYQDEIGMRTGLSAGDITAINGLYP